MGQNGVSSKVSRMVSRMRSTIQNPLWSPASWSLTFWCDRSAMWLNEPRNLEMVPKETTSWMVYLGVIPCLRDPGTRSDPTERTSKPRLGGLSRRRGTGWNSAANEPYGCGSKLTRRGYAGFGSCFHLPGFHFGTGFLSHSHIRHQWASSRGSRSIF